MRKVYFFTNSCEELLNSEPGSMSLLDLMDSDPWPTELAWMSQLITPEDSVAADCSRQIATSVCQPDHAPAPYNVSAGTDAAAANTNLAAPCIKTDISEILTKASIDSINDHHQITPSSRSPIRQKRHRYLISALFELPATEFCRFISWNKNFPGL